MPTSTPLPPNTTAPEAPKTIEQAIHEAIAAARAACAAEGPTSTNCAVAWDIVEELQAERSHQAVAHPPQSSFERYCEENPEADECRIYDV
ncbi:MAG TPA: Calvin cycle protein CP12 [Synechococcales cyanobacterium M55_K2018_004]|nr:Calvin cycle protein CP12 [Synechococcales cyanobacterium M55_K2018_004]